MTLQAYLDEMGELYKRIGRPVLEGRFVALLLTCSAPISMRDAAAALGVTKGALSRLATGMVNRGDIKRSEAFPTREHLYDLVDHAYIRDLLERREVSQRIAELSSRMAGADGLEKKGMTRLLYHAGIQGQVALGLGTVLLPEERIQAADLKEHLEKNWDALPARESGEAAS